MSDLDRPRLALYVALGLVACVLGARYLGVRWPAGAAGSGSPAGATAPGATGSQPAGQSGAGSAPAVGDGAQPAPAASVQIGRADGGRVTVHVAGAVRHPGLYRLAAGARIDDALRRAGGPARGADLDAVNLAAKLEDGRQVLVPKRASATATARAGSPGAAVTASAAAPMAPVNLNTATIEQLDTLDGVGPGIAQRIIDYREQKGGFRRVEELGEVPGIGPKRLASLTPQVVV